MKRAWYLGHSADAVGDRAILIGDPGRLPRIAEHLGDAAFLPVTRGLETLTGRFSGRRITVAAFGMGAPIAAIVLHELADLGVTRFVRLGTAMYLRPAAPGDLMISRDAIGFDGVDEEGEFLHMPEQCPEELKDYEEWERDLRKGGEPGEQAYKLILWAAKREWGHRFREAWQDGPAMTERTLAWAEWRRSVQDSCG